ncbi:MAG: RNA polymerase sigma-70 factor [Microscillaceae bacterium]|nr:RNA polymerase sigma-70 factor [Microscillaceae bacterium]
MEQKEKKYSQTQTLLFGLKKGDEQAFHQIYLHYWKGLFVFAFKILKNQQVCEDIIQEVFTDLWQKKDRADIQNLGAYLTQMTKYKVFQFLRKGKLAQKYIDRFNVVHMVNSTEEKLHFDELRATIEQQLAEVAPRCREIFLLSRFENLSNHEIADKLDISLQTVKNQLSLALNHLRQSLNLNNEGVSVLMLLLFFVEF